MCFKSENDCFLELLKKEEEVIMKLWGRNDKCDKKHTVCMNLFTYTFRGPDL